MGSNPLEVTLSHVNVGKGPGKAGGGAVSGQW